jgi:hypothetical protein
MTPLNLQQRQQQQQQNQQQQLNRRSHSVPSLQRQHPSPRPVEHPVTLARDHIHSSSAVNLLALSRENIFPPTTYTAYFPKSPRLMPCVSPGAVTPMQLEEDMDYRFPSISNTSIRHSPLVVPVSLEEEENGNETETFLEIRIR